MADLPTKYLGIRVRTEWADKMEQVLNAEGMTITEYVRGLIREDLRERGLITQGLEREPVEAVAQAD